MVDNKVRTYVSILSGGTGGSITPEKLIPGKKKNMKSLAMSPPRKDPIPNKDIKILGTEKDQSLPPQLTKYCPGYKSLINKAEDGRNDYTDTSRTDKEDSVNNPKAINNKNIDDEYKYYNSQDHNSNESVNNKNKEEEALMERFMSMHFPLKVVNYVIGTITSCGKNDRIGKIK